MEMVDRDIDLWGLALNVIYLFLVCVRILPFFKDESLVERSLENNRIKLAFHLSLAVSAMLEIVNYALAVVLDGVTLASFACHIISLWMSLVAFSLVIVLWSNTLNPPRTGLSLSPTALFVGAVDVIVLVSTVTLLTTWRFPSAYSRPYLILVVTYSNFTFILFFTSVTLFLLAYWLVVYGLRLQRRVVSHPRWEPLDRRQRVKILCRINGVLVVCAACFLLRIAVLSSAFFLWSRQRALNTNHLLFEVLARWIPGLVPGGALLYIMRKTGRDGGGQASQSMRPGTILIDVERYYKPAPTLFIPCSLCVGFSHPTAHHFTSLLEYCAGPALTSLSNEAFSLLFAVVTDKVVQVYNP